MLHNRPLRIAFLKQRRAGIEHEHGFLLASKLNLLGHESHLICHRPKQTEVHISKMRVF